MALRIGGGRVPAPAMEEEMAPEEMGAPEDLLSELPESLGEEPMAEEAAAGGDVDPIQVNYKTGEERESQACGNCKYYTNNACSIVAGEIDPEGICNIYAPMGNDMEQMPVEEEVPMEEPEAEEASQEGY